MEKLCRIIVPMGNHKIGRGIHKVVEEVSSGVMKVEEIVMKAKAMGKKGGK